MAAEPRSAQLDVLRDQKKRLLHSRRDDLVTRSMHNPYLNNVIDEYDALQARKKKKNADLVEALQIIETHIKELQQSTSTAEPSDDILEKLQDDLQHVQNKITQKMKK
jgi:hypothetical protein